MSGGQDEASERISTSDLPYWLAGPMKELENRVQFLESTVKDLDSCFARLDEKYEELSQAVGRLEPPAEIPQAVRDILDLLKSGRQSIAIPPAIQREVEEVIAERRGEQPPAKRREWWVLRNLATDQQWIYDTKPTRQLSDAWELVRVIAAPTEAEIEEAVRDLMFYTGLRSDTDKARVKTAIRKLLGGGE